MPPGRPSSFNPQVATTIVRAIRKGVPIAQAAALVGVTAKTVYDWLARGDAEEAGEYRDFRERFYKARANLCRQAVKVQHAQLSHENPTVSGAASRFLLTHSFSSDFRTRQETTGPDGGPVTVSAQVTTSAIPLGELARMSPEQLRALGEGIEAAQAKDEEGR